MNAIQKMQFDMTVEMNKDYPIKCRVCGKENTLIRAHYSDWVYRGRLEGLDKLDKFLCKECKYE